ncbi:winged helix-turn-helix transcriptional regulator [Halogeometricum borinquense]|uniref:Winged helix-turn-helix transcriptional regulator n=1 Tax=Halogeometricum borinquense TaxID=60847 RepID=A0A6C0UGZ4_9EURY|nr:winged helix-turn-helix domain-containing protein [Halogeometricum borinquense]QIB74477.1 winged helix-turn-helix transcriptional regulator [Halogeometricum borinquense]
MADLGGSSYDDTYAALTDETRVQILFALADQYDEAWSSGWLSFSQLRERVGVADTSRFSYHLDELQDELVRKIDGRYRPRVAALEIVSAIRAGTYDGEAVTVDRRQTEYQCPHCEQSLVITYQDHLLYVGCPDHGAAVAYPVPPRAVTGRTIEDVLALSLRKHACDVRLLRDGVCPHCWSTAGLSFPRESVPDSYLLDDVPYATAACDTCWLSYPIPVAHTVLGHPAVETLYADHGFGLADAQIGPHNLARVADVVCCTSDSPAVRLTIDLGDRPLVFELDESCAVLDYWRR